MQLEIKPSHQPIRQYYTTLAEFEKHGATKETSVRAAFQEILTTYARKKKWSFIAEEGITLEEKWSDDGGLNFRVEKMKLKKNSSSQSSPSSRRRGPGGGGLSGVQGPPPNPLLLKEGGQEGKTDAEFGTIDLIYNKDLTLTGIPAEAFEYRLGNRSAIDWIIDQYQVSTDKRSGITNDPNREDDEQYIVRLIRQVVTVSLETVRIVGEIAKTTLE